MNGITRERRPPGYRPPTFKEVKTLLDELRQERQAKIAQIVELKQARRDEWSGILEKIPASYRKMAAGMGFPDLGEMGDRIAGLIARKEPVVEVVPPSGNSEDIRRASAEEARLHALRVSIEDQQSRPVYQLGIHSLVNVGESWLSVMPDPSRLPYDDEEDDHNFKRGKDEDAEGYIKRYKAMMADGCIPIAIEDHDPQTVFPLMSRNRLAVAIIETEHTAHQIKLGLGYKPVTGAAGDVTWAAGATLSEGLVPEQDATASPRIVDTTHDNPAARSGTSRPGGAKIQRIVYMDAYVVCTYLDGVLVERWEHNYGFVPMFPAFAGGSGDREPGQESRAVIWGAYGVAKQLVLWAAMLTASGMQHAWPTPFLRNPDHGIASGFGREPQTRKVTLGALNLLGPNEQIEFPYLDAKMGNDFFANLDFLVKRFEGITLNAWGANISAETSGYAIAQVRALQSATLGPVYMGTARQWRQVLQCARHIVRSHFPDGVYLRGAVETVEKDGEEVSYAPIMTYAKKDTTDFTINVHIDEGVIQDELAERKSSLEMHQAGAWSMRRVREGSGVDDPQREQDEIDTERMMNSPAMDQNVITMAMAMAAARFTAAQKKSPFAQALEQAQQEVLGIAAGDGQFANQGGEPANANPGGQPVQQNPPMQAPQQGGPTAGAPAFEELGAAGIPGGIKQSPAVRGV